MAISFNARAAAVLLNAYVRKRVEPIYRESYLLDEMKKRGLISLAPADKIGKTLKWKPRFVRHNIEAGPGNPNVTTFSPLNLWQEASLGWVTYHLGEKVSKMERLTTTSTKNAYFVLAKEVAETAAKDFLESFRFELYVDDSATGNGKRLCGLNSMFGGDTIHNAVVPAVAPSDTYAGLSTVLGNYGGDWSSSVYWPESDETCTDTEYSAWSPVIIDYTSTTFTGAGGTHTWATQWQEAINYLFTHGSLLQKSKYDALLLNAELVMKAKNSLIANQKIEIESAAKSPDAAYDVMRYNGMTLATEFGMPANKGYALKFDKMELISLQKQLVATEEDTDIVTSDTLMKWDFYGQLKCESPAYFGQLQDLA